MQIEAVSVCVDYGDFLEQAAPHNRSHLGRWVVVTCPDDERTRSVCRRFGLEVVLTSELKRDGNFSKGRLIDRGLTMLGGQSWLLHLDADIVLPVDLKQVLDDAHLDPAKVHGCDRLNVSSRKAWDTVRQQPLLCRGNAWAVHLERAETTVGARVANVGLGWSPIGFFQLWHGGVTGVNRYPYHHGTAARSDVQFGLLWDRRDRVLIPELIVWHLESEVAPMGHNWHGRRTKPFEEECNYALSK